MGQEHGGKFSLYLSRNDRANVSYFTGIGYGGEPEQEWVERWLLPNIYIIAARRAKVIHNTPIAFWACVRETARQPAGEIFLFSTPWRTAKLNEDAIRKALAVLPSSGKVFQAVEMIPGDAVPLCQAFRGKLLRFYSEYGNGRYGVFTIRWEENRPHVLSVDIDPSLVFFRDNQESEYIHVRADLEESSNGDFYRLWQQALVSFAMRADT